MSESLLLWVNRSFRSNQKSDVSEALILLTKNEQPWGIRSGPSEEMSDVSESLISLTKWGNEWITHFFRKSLIRSFFDKKRAIRKLNERIPSPVEYVWD